MTYKKQLILYLNRKDEILFDLTELHYVNDFDLMEIQQEWTEKDSYDILGRLSTRSDADSCPWCLKCKNCDECGYGIRHKVCYRQGVRSLFRAITDRFFKFSNLELLSLVSHDKIKKLIISTKRKFYIKRFFDFITYRIPKNKNKEEI